MRARASSFSYCQRTVRASITLAIAAVFGFTAIASAKTTANTKIVNVAKVSYKDVSLTNNFYANASSTVTVNLVAAALNFSGPPAAANGAPALVCQTGGSYSSGSTISKLYALTSTANGVDSYDLTQGAGTGTNVNGIVTNVYPVDYAGIVGSALAKPSATITNWGSAVPVGVQAGGSAVNKATLLFPGGSLNGGFAVNDIVLVDQGGASKIAYRVVAFTNGSPATHDNSGGGPYTTLGTTGTEGLTAEVQGTLQLGPLAAVSGAGFVRNGTSGDFAGSASAPDFVTTPYAAGSTVNEIKLYWVDVTASTTSTLANGTVDWTLTDASATTPAATSNQQCTTIGEWIRPQLSITKEVTKTPGSGWASTVAGGVTPNSTLEYRLTIANPGGDASRVTVTDTVPAYTTLIAGGATYGAAGAAAAANIFAKAKVNAGADVLLTMQNTDNEGAGTVASGFTGATALTAGTAMTFYVGGGSTNAQGGTVNSSNTYYIYYTVKVD